MNFDFDVASYVESTLFPRAKSAKRLKTSEVDSMFGWTRLLGVEKSQELFKALLKNPALSTSVLDVALKRLEEQQQFPNVDARQSIRVT